MLVMELHGKKPRESKSRPSSELVLPVGKIGLEFEVEHAERFDPAQPKGAEITRYFSNHTDGSLRDNGTEFVLREPLYGEDLLDAVRSIREGYKLFKFTSSYRTSMHVHVDMERASYPDQILNLAFAYAVAEPLIYKFIGNSRDACNYCLPWYRHDQHFYTFLDAVHSLNGHTNNQVVTQMRRLKEYKYSGLNFFSLGDFGTVEFRHAPVDMSYEKVIEWINIIQSLRKYAGGFQAGKPQLRQLLANACSVSYVQFLEEVFGKHSKSLTRLCPRPSEAYALGLKTASSFTAASVARGLA